METKVTAIDIKLALEQYHGNPNTQIFFEVKNGPTWTASKGSLFIMDALAIKKSWSKPCFTGYEIKVSRSDFLHDEKWHKYLDYCNKFYFVCPKGLIKREEIESMDKSVGLMYYHPNYSNFKLNTVKAPAFRKMELKEDFLYYIIMSKLESDRYPFTSGKKEFYKQWLKGKRNNIELGCQIKGVIKEAIINQETKLEEMEKKYKSLKYKEDQVEEFFEYLRSKNVATWISLELKNENWKEELDELFKTNLSKGDIEKIKNALHYVEILKEII